MYNEETKIRFIRDYTSSVNTAKTAATVFNAIEKYEINWGSDFCTKSKEELQPVVDSITGLRTKSKWMTIIILREYVKWCMSQNIPNSCDGMLNTESVSLAKMKLQMVSNPIHLQKVLDGIFEPESEETIDDIYRCYFWMAYSGIDEPDTILITSEDVILEEMLIKYKDSYVPIYREALPAFRNVVRLKSFFYKHPSYSKPIYRDRVLGNNILRGIKSTTKINVLRSTISNKIDIATKAGNNTTKLSFARIKLSGLFYRVFEVERAGFPADFSEVVIKEMGNKEYKLQKNQKLKHKYAQRAREYMEDYQRWKLTFL